MISATVAVLPSIGAGTAMAFSSTAASQYRTENATSLYEPLTNDESSWFGENPKNLFFSLAGYELVPS
jgi:hypothetical protein